MDFDTSVTSPKYWKCCLRSKRVFDGHIPEIKIWTQSSSQDFAKRGGGAFLEVWYNCKQTWPKFSLVLNEIEAVFLSKSGDLKKKGLHRNSKGFSCRNQVISKKKVFTDFGWAPEPKNSTILVQITTCPSQLLLPNPVGCGLFSILEQKSR